MSRVGGSKDMKSPMAACSRSTTPLRSRTCGDDTRPPLTWHHHLVRRAAGPVDEVEHPVDATVCPASLLRLRLGLQQRQSPELELVGVLLPQGAGAALVLRLADDVVVVPASRSKAVLRRFFIRATARCVMSIPSHCRASLCAATTAVPQPQNGSSTTFLRWRRHGLCAPAEPPVSGRVAEAIPS